MNDSIKILIKKHTRDFLESRLSTIQKIRFEDFEINPYLIASVKKQLGMKKQRDLARWLVTQRSERGMVTAFGSTLQKIAKEFSDEPTTSGFTMTLKKRSKKYNIVVTSGPNPYAKTQAVDLRNRLIASKETDPNSTPILGMCYGNKDAVSPIVKSELKNIKYYAGREFWEFISGETVSPTTTKIAESPRGRNNGYSILLVVSELTGHQTISFRGTISTKFACNCWLSRSAI